MTAKINIRASLILAFFVALTSCSGFLDLEPSDSVEKSKAITSVNGANVALNGILRDMTALNYYGRRMVFYADMKGGDFLVPSGGRGDDALWSFNHESNNNAYTGYWNIMYDVILQANNIIENIDAGKVKTMSTAEENTVKDIKGQVLFIRALAHFDLVRVYGYPYLKPGAPSTWGAAVVTRTLAYDETLKRNTVEETYKQVTDDLTAAIPLLKTAKNNGYINAWAAKSLLARVYLYKGDWDDAYAMAKDVITNGGYTLYSNANWVSSWKSQFGTESILELVITPSQNDQGTSSPASFLCPKYYRSNNMAAAVASTTFLTALSEDMTDVRWGVMAIDEYGYVTPATSTTPEKPALIPNRKGWIKKYEGDGKSTTTATDIKVIRLSEIYLIGAEAALKLQKTTPDLTNAVKWLNDIRKRSPGLAAATTADTDLEDKILNERRKELVAEGHRYFDQLRLGKTITFEEPLFGDPTIPSTGRGTTVDWNFNKCVLPIGHDEILVNPNIKDQQNPGYGL